MNIKKFIPDILVIILFASISFAYFYPADIEGRIIFRHDIAAGAGAGQEAKEYHENTGKTTRWTNSLFGGMPTYQIAPSYPSTNTLKYFEKAYRLFLPDYVCLVFILMLGFYIMLRCFGMPLWLSALGGILWAFSSYFFILIAAGHIWKFITLAYIPPTIGGLVLAYRGKYIQGASLAALFTALQIMSNHFQMSYYFFFVMLFLAIAYGVKAYKEGEMNKYIKATTALAIGGILGILVNLSNIYHTYEYSKLSMRGQNELVSKDAKPGEKQAALSKEYITQWSYGKGETLTLLIPNFKGGASSPLSASPTAMEKANYKYGNLYGQFTQYFGDQPMTAGPVYVGAFVCFLFILGCFIVKGPIKWAIVGATLFSIILAWGKNFMLPTDLFIDYIPFYNKFRAVSSILVIAEFTIPLLGIMALYRIISEPNVLNTEKNALKISAMTTIGLCLIVAISPSLLEGGFMRGEEEAVLKNAVTNGAIPEMEYLSIVMNISDMRSALVTSDAWRSLAIIAIGCLLLYLFYKKTISDKLLIGALAILCLVDLWGVNKRYLNDGLFVKDTIKTSNFKLTDTDKIILEDEDKDFRVLNLASDVFNENNTSYHHKSIGGYHAAKIRRYQDLIDRYIAKEMQNIFREVSKHKANMDEVDENAFKVVNMLNAKYLIFPLDRSGNTAPILNPWAYGNAWFVEKIKFVDNANDEIDALAELNLHKEAVIDQKFANDIPKSDDNITTEGKIKLTEYSPNRLVYKTESTTGGVAVFSEVYYPYGWIATIDGKPATIARANYVLRTMYIPRGEHTVVMEFNPKSIDKTETIAYISLIFMLLSLGGGIIIAMKKNK